MGNCLKDAGVGPRQREGKEGTFEGLTNFSPIFWGISQLIDANNTELPVASVQNQWRLLCTDKGGKPGSDATPS